MKTGLAVFMALFMLILIKFNFHIKLNSDIYMGDMFGDRQLTVNDYEGITWEIKGSMPSFRFKPYTMRVTQTVKPESGLILKPLINGKQYTFSHITREVIEQSVSSSTPGDYEITTTSTLIETGQSVIRTVKFKVLPINAPNLSISPPNIHLEPNMLGKPVVLKPNTITKVAFGMGSVSGKDYYEVRGMTVVEPKRNIKIELNDKGLGTDNEANDKIYGSESYISINSAGMNTGECMTFYTIVHTTKGDANSRGEDLCVSALGLGGYRYADEDWIDGSSVKTSRSTIEVDIRKGTTDARIQQIAASIDSTIVGADPRFGDFTFKLNQIPTENDARNIMAQKSKQLTLFPEVVSAEPSISLKMDIGF